MSNLKHDMPIRGNKKMKKVSEANCNKIFPTQSYLHINLFFAFI